MNILFIYNLFILIFSIILPYLFAKKHQYNIRNFLLTISTILFIINVIIVDYIIFNTRQIDYSEAICLFKIFGTYEIKLHLEPIGLIFINLIAILWLIATLYTTGFLVYNKIANQERFLSFMNMTILAAYFIALSANLITMFIFYEILTLITLPLILHNAGAVKNPSYIYGGMKKYSYILFTSALMLFLPAIVMTRHYVGHSNFIDGGILLGSVNLKISLVILLLFIFGIAKAAIYPMHGWLPSAMVAPYPVSALLHAVVVVKTGLFCVYKILLYIFGSKLLALIAANFNWIVIFPIVTIIYSSMQSLRFMNIKTILAYSTINQLSIALMSAFMLTKSSIKIAVLHMVSHAFTKICLFYTAGNMYSISKSINVRDLISLRKRAPITALCMLISGLSLIGMPPFAGFVSKFAILKESVILDNRYVIATLILSSIFSAIYMLKILIFLFRPTNKYNDSFKMENIKEQHLPKNMIYSIILIAIFIIFFYYISLFMDEFTIN